MKFAPGHIESAANTTWVEVTVWSYCVYMFVAATWWQRPLVCWFTICIIPPHQYLRCSALAHVHTACTWNAPGLYKANHRGISFTGLLRKVIQHLAPSKETGERTDLKYCSRYKARTNVHCSALYKEEEPRLGTGFPGKISKGHELLNIIPWHKMETRAN